MQWLAECSVPALREALGAVAPELGGYPVTVPRPAAPPTGVPLWHSGCVPVGDRFFVKFAWSRPAALRLAREIGVLAALHPQAQGPVPARGGRQQRRPASDDHQARAAGIPASARSSARSTRTAPPGSSCGSWPPCMTRPPASAPRMPWARSPARTCRRPRPGPCVNGWGRGSGRISAGPSSAGATGPTPCSARLARPCSCTVTCTAITRSGTAASSGWWWTSRTSGPPSPNTSYAAFPGPGMGRRPGAADRDHAPLPAGRRTAAVARRG